MKKIILLIFVSCMIIGSGLFSQIKSSSVYATSQFTPQINGGLYHTVALKDDGTVWVWGNNYYGQLGDGTNINTTTPKKLENISNVKAISTGYYHNLALKTDGTLWAWGKNSEYQLGDGTTTDRKIPVQVAGINNVKAIAAGDNHSMILKEDGTVWAWGTNYAGQLGDGTTISRGNPAIVPGLTDITAIAASDDYSFALKSDGTLWGWGYNCYGQLGLGTSENIISTPTEVPGLSGVKAMTCGLETVYALTNEGEVWAWGGNSNGELGLGYSLENVIPHFITTPTKIPALSNVAALSARGFSVVAQKEDGTIWAWGKNTDGQVGDGTNISKTSPIRISGLDNVFSVSSGLYHTLAIKNNGSVYVWGDNSTGELGDGSNTDKYTPILVPSFSLSSNPVNLTATAGDGKVCLNWSSVLDNIYYIVKRSETAGGPYTTVDANIGATTYTDTAVTNGTTYFYIVTAVNLNGQVTVFNEISATPFKVAIIPQITGGGYHTVGLMSDSTVWVWGSNEYGQLGDNTKLSINTCERLENFSDVKAVAAADYHSIAVKIDGTVWAWGQNNFGQLGDGTTIDRCAPVQVVNISDVKKVTTGQYFSAALKTDGTVWTWGSNTFGQLGDGTTISRSTPVQVSGLTNIISIAAGDEFIFAIKDDGTLWAWGRNENHEICDSTSSNVSTPLQITSIAGVKDVACGYNAVYVIKLDGTLWAWGSNSFGQIGNGTSNYYINAPVQVSGLYNNVKAVSAGACFAVALLNDGTVRAWGRNDDGQIGDGTTADKNTPTPVTGLTNVLTIGCGSYHALAYKNDGSVFAWGANWSGELGDGTNSGKLTPVNVPNVGLLSLLVAPKNLMAKVGNTKVVLTWDVATGAASYNVKRAQTAGGPYTTIASINNVTTTTFTDTTVTNDTTYYYIVTSVNKDGESPGLTEVSAVPNANKPPAPSNLIAEPDYTKVTLRWSAVEGAYTYNVKRSDWAGGPYTTIAVNLTGTTFTDTGLTDGSRYYYIVTAVNDNGEGPSSSVISAVPAVPGPSNLTATAGNLKVSLRWTKGTGVLWTRVIKATSSYGVWENLVTTTGSTYDDTEVTIGTTYNYVVVSVLNGEESAGSNEVSAIPYAVPSNLSAIAGNARVTLTWVAATGSIYYNVKRANTSGGPYTTIAANVTGTIYDDTTVINGTKYYYVVTTFSGGDERVSNEVSATPGVPSYEPNDSMGTAYAISNNTTITTTISSSSDVDYFKYTISSTSNSTVTLTPPPDKDYDLYLFNSSGTQIGSSINGTGTVDAITKSSLAAGTYYVKVVGYSGAYSTTPYTLRISSN